MIVNEDRPTNVLIVGVGGQGVIMISKVLARICQQQGFQVKQSEVHGMAKRGGVVFSHLRFGREVWSPIIPQGGADVLLAMEWAEGLRWLSSLNPDSGIYITDTQRIVPPFACLSRQRGAPIRYTQASVAEVIEQVPNSFAADAAGIAAALGNERASNTVLLGILSTVLDFPQEIWLSVLPEFVPERTIELNLQAFQQGRDWVRQQREEGLAPTEQAPLPIPPAAADLGTVRLLIEDAWCKGCDICVKMCPERCLVLNAHEIVELNDADACTGCRICEMLCPDFAITVRFETETDEIHA